MITAKKVKTTRTSQLMAFVSLEDMVGTVEALVFPKIYEKNKQYLTEDSKVFLRGRASIGDDPVGKLVCEEVIPFSAIPNELWLQFEDQEFYERTVDSVMAVLRESEGKDRVVMYLKRERKLRQMCIRDRDGRRAGNPGRGRTGGGEAHESPSPGVF